MQGRNVLRLVALMLLQAGCLVAALPERPGAWERKEAAKLAAARLSGPYSHDNLTIYLIHGENKPDNRKFITLADALAQKKFVVHETQRVNDLLMENLSADEDVILISGDILKGGQQDRVVQFDRVVPPKSGKLSLTVFCVERTASRWMKPLEGVEKTFAASPGCLATNGLRLACRSEGNQTVVWKEVAGTQKDLAARVGGSVQDARSDSSLALSLDAKKVAAGADHYVKKLSAIVNDEPAAVGYVFAINDKVVGGDVYGSPALFRKVWPRLLRANGVEAFAEMKKDKKHKAPDVPAFRAFLKDAVSGESKSQSVGKDVRQLTCEGKYNYLYQSLDEKRGETLRWNFLAKKK